MPKPSNRVDGNSNYESSYLRRKKPVQVRRNFWRKSGFWMFQLGLILVLVAGVVSTAFSIETYLREAAVFKVNKNSPVRLTGLQYTSRHEVEEILYQGGEVSSYDFPLEESRHQIERLPWVKHVALKRSWPDRLWVHVEERSPVAFVRPLHSIAKNQKATPQLIDNEGNFLDLPEGSQFVFPVLTGVNQKIPKEENVKRLQVYEDLLSALDATEPFYSPRISEIDLTDPRNVKVLTAFDGEMIELQMGEKNFRHRFEVFIEYFETWKNEFGRVKSVDLRYKGVVVTE